MLLGLGDHNGEDAVLEVGADGVLVNSSGEVEAARELANAALSEPVLGLVGRLLLLGLLLGFLLRLLLGLLLLASLAARLVSN